MDEEHSLDAVFLLYAYNIYFCAYLLLDATEGYTLSKKSGEELKGSLVSYFTCVNEAVDALKEYESELSLRDMLANVFGDESVPLEVFDTAECVSKRILSLHL